MEVPGIVPYNDVVVLNVPTIRGDRSKRCWRSCKSSYYLWVVPDASDVVLSVSDNPPTIFDVPFLSMWMIYWAFLVPVVVKSDPTKPGDVWSIPNDPDVLLWGVPKDSEVVLTLPNNPSAVSNVRF